MRTITKIASGFVLFAAIACQAFAKSVSCIEFNNRNIYTVEVTINGKSETIDQSKRFVFNSCGSSTCDISIMPLVNDRFTFIKGVPNGSRVTYYMQNQYDIDKNANVTCPN